MCNTIYLMIGFDDYPAQIPLSFFFIDPESRRQESVASVRAGPKEQGGPDLQTTQMTLIFLDIFQCISYFAQLLLLPLLRPLLLPGLY